MNTMTDARRNDLAKIHIAKKQLGLDDDTYRTIVRDVGRAASGSAAQLDAAGRARVLKHLKRAGFRVKRKKRVTSHGDILASRGQVAMIRSLWIQMADAGAVHERSEQALRKWVRQATRRYHDDHAGYSAPEFLPERVAQRVIEHLKAWARRCKVTLDE